jgi:hypothetical protein
MAEASDTGLGALSVTVIAALLMLLTRLDPLWILPRK